MVLIKAVPRGVLLPYCYRRLESLDTWPSGFSCVKFYTLRFFIQWPVLSGLSHGLSFDWQGSAVLELSAVQGGRNVDEIWPFVGTLDRR